MVVIIVAGLGLLVGTLGQKPQPTHPRVGVFAVINS